MQEENLSSGNHSCLLKLWHCSGRIHRRTVSARPFDQYVEENIFKPLGMTQSTFVQPLPTTLTGQMSNGYKLGSDEAKEFEVVNVPPAGSLSSTASDMARFIIAHLQDGQFGSVSILSRRQRV